MDEERYESEQQSIEEIPFEQARQLAKDCEDITEYIYVNLCRGIWDEVERTGGTAKGKPNLFDKRIAEELAKADIPITRFASFVVEPSVEGPGKWDLAFPGGRKDPQGRPLRYVSPPGGSARIFHSAF